MIFFRKISEVFSRLNSIPMLDSTFEFPYSSDQIKKREEIWSNLQKGILLEDEKSLIPWKIPFNQINKYSKNRIDSGDRTEWYLGKHIIFDGYESHLETMKWSNVFWTNSMSHVSEKIGTDSEGNKNFLFLKHYLTKLLGKPSKIELEKFGSYDLGLIEWTNGKIKISLDGIEIFNCRYHLTIEQIEN